MPSQEQYLVDPSDNEVRLVPAEQVEEARSAGYADASEGQIKQFDAQRRAHQDSFGTLKAAAESAAQVSLPAMIAGIPAAAMGIIPSISEIGGALGVVSPEIAEQDRARRIRLAQDIGKYTTVSGLEQTLGLTTAEDIEARREAHPVAAGVGMVAGLVGPGLLAKAGLSAGRLGERAVVAAEEAVAKEAAAIAFKGEEAQARALADNAIKAAEAATKASAKAAKRAELLSKIPGGEAIAQRAEQTLGALEKVSGPRILSETSRPIYEGAERYARAAIDARMPAASKMTKAIVSKALALPVGSAVEGAMLSTGAIADEMTLGDPKAVAEKALAEIGEGALLGAGLGGALGIVGVMGYGAIQGARSATRRLDKLFKEKFAPLSARVTGADVRDVQAMVEQRAALGERELRDIIDERLGRLPPPPMGIQPKEIDEVATQLADGLDNAYRSSEEVRKLINQDLSKIETEKLVRAKVNQDADEMYRAISDSIGAREPTYAEQYQLDNVRNMVSEPYRARAKALLDDVKSVLGKVDDPKKYPDVVRRRLAGLDEKLEDFLNANPEPEQIFAGFKGAKGDIWGGVTSRDELASLKAADRQANGEISRLYGRFAEFLSDEGLWGKAAAREAATNEALTARDPVVKNVVSEFFKKISLPGGRKGYRINNDAVRSFVKNIKIDPITGAPDQSSIEKLNLLRDFIGVNDQLVAQGVEGAKYAEQNFNKEMVAQTLRNTADAVDEAMRRPMDVLSKEAVDESYKALQSARSADIDARIKAIQSGAKSGGIQDMLGIATRGGAAGYYLHPAIGIMSAAAEGAIRLAADPVKTIKRFRSLERMAKSADAKINGYIGNIVGKPTGREFSRVVFTGALPATQEREAYQKNTQRVRELATDETAIENHLDNSTGGLRHDAPRLSDHADTVTSSAVSYLNSQIPQPPANLSPMQLKAWKPTDAQVRRFNQMYRTVDMPLSILHDAERGLLQREQVDAVATVYPTLIEEIRSQIIGKLEENPDLSASSRRMASLILGLDLDGSMPLGRAAQQVYATQSPPDAAKSQQMPVSRAKGLTSSGRTAQETTAWREAQDGIGRWNRANR